MIGVLVRSEVASQELLEGIAVMDLKSQVFDKRPVAREAGDVLIDDATNLREAWEGQRGMFILHTSTAQTLQELSGYVTALEAC